MKVIINNLPKTLPDIKDENLEKTRISIDPEKRYAVLEVFRKELFVAVKINSMNGDILDCEYVDKFAWWNDFTMLTDFCVNWDCIEYGFCKLTMWAPELANEYGGYFDHTAKRFYFDWELYKKRYEELNGVPCTKKNPNE